MVYFHDYPKLSCLQEEAQKIGLFFYNVGQMPLLSCRDGKDSLQKFPKTRMRNQRIEEVPCPVKASRTDIFFDIGEDICVSVKQANSLIKFYKKARYFIGRASSFGWKHSVALPLIGLIGCTVGIIFATKISQYPDHQILIILTLTTTTTNRINEITNLLHCP